MSSIGNAIHRQSISKPSFDKINARSTKIQENRASTTAHVGYNSNAQSTEPFSGMTQDDHAQSKERFKWMHNAAMVQHGEEILTRPIEANTLQFQHKLTVLASNRDEFNQLMHSAFGDRINVEALDAFRERVLANDFSWLPQIEYVDRNILLGADGAYAASTNTIYLSSSSTDAGLDFLVYAEEVGHCIDQMINTKDGVGDEGALFAAHLVGAPLSEADRELLKAANDTGLITIGATDVDVEFSKLSKEIGRLDDNFKDWVRNAREFFQRANTAFVGLIDDISEIITTVMTRPLDVLRELGPGLKRVFELIYAGKFGQAGTEIRDLLKSTGKIALGVFPEVVAMTFSAAVMAIDRLRGAVTERPLKSEEISYLQNIFGDSIDYSSVVIISGGTKDQWGMDAHVVGNEIFMPNTLSDGTPMFDADGGFSPGGLALLGHEAAHVWQFQHFGTGYIGVSLVSQLYDGDNDTYDWYHEIAAGTAFNDMNPEQQAEIAGLIGEAAHHRLESGEEPTLNLDALNAVLADTDIEITSEQFGLFVAASLILDPGVASSKMAKPPREHPLREIELQLVAPSV